MSAVPTLSADDLAVVAVDTQADRMVIAAYQGDAIAMSPGQFAQLVEAAKSGMVIGRREVLRAIESEDGDDANHGVMDQVSVRFADNATQAIELLTRSLLQAPAELLHRALELIERRGGLADVVALQVDRDPAAGADQFVARFQLSQLGLELAAALGAIDVDA